MVLTVNGEERQIPEGASLADLLANLGVNRSTVVVERNGTLVRQADHDAVHLTDRDRLEIVRFVAGG
jgi:thiamine biosynthesis protein ThiS